MAKKPRRFINRSSLSVLASSISVLAGALQPACGDETITLPNNLRSFPPLSSDLPYDVDVKEVRKLDKEGKILTAQREFDILAWQAFLALNWPADASGTPLDAKYFNNTEAPRIWSFWRTADSIFLPDGADPKPWSEGGNGQNNTLYRAKAAWRQNTTPASENFEAFSGPLVDQNGNWVRYEVLVNREEFDYLVGNKLFNLDGQVEFSRREKDNEVMFPVNEGTTKHGAIEIKLAWKQLGKNDDRSRFYVTKVKVAKSEPYKPGQTQPEMEEIEAGLVGMHISMRTESSPEWIWATFEQVDNVRQNKDAHGNLSHPNFYNPNQPQPVNVLPPKNAVIDPATGSPVITTDSASASTWVESLTKTPVQLARIKVPTQPGLNPLDASITAEANALNTDVQQILQKAGSVFQYYELIGTQWPVHPNAPAFAGGEGSAPESIKNKTPGDVVPVFNINTTMETYFQKGQQPAGPLEQDDRLSPTAPPIDSTVVTGTESCVGCHYSSGICIGFKTDLNGKPVLQNGQRVPVFGENNHFGKTGGANFSWLLQIEARAKPVKPEATKEAGAVRNPARFLQTETPKDLQLHKAE